MEKILKKYQKNLEKSISNINRYSKKISKINLRNMLIMSVFISIVILKVTRSYIVNLPSKVFYILVISILILFWVIPIIVSKVIYKKYIRVIDKNIKSINKNLNNLYDKYQEKLIKKINSINNDIEINSVSASIYIENDELVEYELSQKIFKEKEDKINKEIYLDNEEKVKYLEETILLIEKFQNTEIYKYFEFISSNNLITQYIPDSDYKKTMDNINKVFKIIDNYFNRRKNLIKNIKQPLDLGIDGEKTVDKYLNIYEDEIINLSNIRLEVNGNSIENDNILITRKGIFILEVKNIGSTGSYSILVQSDGRWIKKFINGTEEVIDFNATEQNDRHIAILQKFLNNKLNRSIQSNNYLQAEGIVVIANNTLDIKNESMQNIYRISEVYRYINKFDNVLTYDEMLEIKDIILKENLKPKKYAILDYKSEISNNIKVFNDLISNIYNEKRNLCTIYKYLEDSRYIECCEWLNKSGILKEFNNSKFESFVSVPNISNEFLTQIGVSSNYNKEKLEEISEFNININKNKPRARGIVIIAIITAVMVGYMNLLYIPGELKSSLRYEKYGYVDENGRTRIRHKYDYVSEFENGLAIVGKNNKYGVIDKIGKEIVNIKYEDKCLKRFENGLIGIKKGNKWTVLNENGKIVSSKQYDTLEDCGGDIICISINKKYGLMDKTGQEVIETIYDSGSTRYLDGGHGPMGSSPNKTKIVILKKENENFIFDNKGKEISRNEYQQINDFYYDCAPVKINNKWGFINNEFKLIVPAKFDRVTKFTRDYSRYTSLTTALGKINGETYRIYQNGLYEKIQN